ncbi:PadR family transcriptional regulator [Natrinema soli]|uniref:PadR family transcriptional regulator n=1 Tax=Natrinema soli TaxID=1930624 RepID=A0ABD5SPZ3_9EURY|nr:PadR family transcriptional regulator [Natrinema soli]
MPNGRTAWIELTAFQRDCLEAVTRLERTHIPAREPAIIDELERAYPSVTRTRLDPNLRVVVGRGLLEKQRLEANQDEYPLTDDGRALLIQRAEHLAVACEISATDSDAVDSNARARGEGNG